MQRYKPDKVYIEEAARNHPRTLDILRRLEGTSIAYIKKASDLINAYRTKPDPIGAGKKSLLLAYDQGNSFKPFPEDENYFSCDYFTLHTAQGCDMECSYCILQSYLNNPLLTVYVNLEEMLDNLQNVLSKQTNRIFRVGTGQLADSLSLDHITAFSETLVPFFAQQQNAILELKTKSDNIDRLIRLEPNHHTVVAWSMNTKYIQETEEHKCATLDERMDAAERLLSRSSYKAAFHYDPIVEYPGWETDYANSLEQLLTRIRHERIAWISLGCLRLMPDLRRIMQDRFQKSHLVDQAEWVRGMDGKLRYFKPDRIAIYKMLAGKIQEIAPDVTVYLSMESPEVWSKVFGKPYTREAICQMLDEAVMSGPMV